MTTKRLRRRAGFWPGLSQRDRTIWLARDPACLAASLEEFTGYPAYNIHELRSHLARFTFLLGGSDGESLFGP